MSVELITGNTGKPVTSASDRRQNAGTWGLDSYVQEIGDMCAAELDGPNKLVVKNGSIMHNGAHIELVGNTEWTIPTGLQAQKRSNLCVLRYTIDEEGRESAEAVTIPGQPVSDGEPQDPAYYMDSILESGVTVSDMPLYRVVTDGINALEPVCMFRVLMPYAKAWDSLSQNLKEVDKHANRIGYVGIADTVSFQIVNEKALLRLWDTKHNTHDLWF